MSACSTPHPPQNKIENIIGPSNDFLKENEIKCRVTPMKHIYQVWSQLDPWFER